MNYCLINPEGGKISVKVTALGGLMTGGKFFLGQPENGNYSVVEEHEVDTGNQGQHTFTIQTSASDLNYYALAWRLRSCMLFQEAEFGKMKIEFFQDQIKLKTTNSIIYRGKFKICQEGYRSTKNQIIFINQSPNKDIKLWESIENS